MASNRLLLWTKETLRIPFKVVTFFCFLNVTNSYICTFSSPYGPSMLPTFGLTGNLLLIDRISTRLGKVDRGDIVLVRSPESPRKIVTKRVIGMEGDRVTYVVDPKTSDESKTIVVPKGHIWIEGDYIYNSRDSRKFGPVPYGLLEGRALFRILPFKDFGALGPRPT